MEKLSGQSAVNSGGAAKVPFFGLVRRACFSLAGGHAALCGNSLTVDKFIHAANLGVTESRELRRKMTVINVAHLHHGVCHAIVPSACFI